MQNNRLSTNIHVELEDISIVEYSCENLWQVSWVRGKLSGEANVIPNFVIIVESGFTCCAG